MWDLLLVTSVAHYNRKEKLGLTAIFSNSSLTETSYSDWSSSQVKGADHTEMRIGSKIIVFLLYGAPFVRAFYAPRFAFF